MEQIQRKKRQAGTLGKYFYVFILPAFVVYLLFSIVPFLYTFYYSFTDYTDMNPVNLSFVGLKNYIKVFNTPLMITAIKNSVLYAIMLTSLQTILALPLAVLLDKKLKTRNLLRAVFFFPAVFSSLIIGYLWNFIMSSSDYGLINNLLHQLGLGTFNFFTADRALFSVILTQAWQWTGWAMVIYLANLQSISPDLYRRSRGNQEILLRDAAAHVPVSQDHRGNRLNRRYEGVRYHLFHDIGRSGQCDGDRYDRHDEKGDLGWLLQHRIGVRRVFLCYRAGDQRRSHKINGEME